MSDAQHILDLLNKLHAKVQEVFDLAHALNEEHSGRVEVYRELASRSSAALYYLGRSVESARQIVKEDGSGEGESPVHS